MKQIKGVSGRTTRIVLGLAPLVILLVAVGAASRGQGQTSPHGIVTPLAGANLVFDGEPACLKVARENGNPDKGASTFLLEAPSGCVVPAHYHTAEEQLMVVRGDVLTGMRLCHDAQQSHALVHLQIKGYLSDVRNVRPHVRHRLGQTAEITGQSSSSFLETFSSSSILAIPSRIA